jgi:hypothetical protein
MGEYAKLTFEERINFIYDNCTGGDDYTQVLDLLRLHAVDIEELTAYKHYIVDLLIDWGGKKTFMRTIFTTDRGRDGKMLTGSAETIDKLVAMGVALGYVRIITHKTLFRRKLKWTALCNPNHQP